MQEKNIRRRVYDALNVLMALEIITKENKKDIRWKGFPEDSEVLVQDKMVEPRPTSPSRISRRAYVNSRSLRRSVCL